MLRQDPAAGSKVPFGTVVNLTVVAPGIAEALFATAMGLAAAIPALIFYNKFSADISAFSERLANFSQEVSARLSRRLNDRGRDV